MEKLKTSFLKHKSVYISILIVLLLVFIGLINYKPYYFENDTQKLKSIANDYLNKLDYENASQVFIKLLNKKNSSSNEFFVGYSLLRANHQHEALSHLLKAIKLDPNNADAYAALGEYYFTFEKVEKGLKETNASLKLKPTYLAYFNLGKFYLNVQDTDNAYNFLTKAHDMAPKQLEIYPYLAEVYTKKGLFVSAFEAYEHYYNEKTKINPPFTYYISDEADYVRKKLKTLRDMAEEL